MSSFISARLWNDPGFTEGCIEVPKGDSVLPEADIIITENLSPNTDVMFSKLTIEGTYSEYMNASYMEVKVRWNMSEDQVYYGWIDKVEPKSDTRNYAATNIYWHVDLWRTYLKQAKFGYGMVMRRPLKENDSVPPQPYPHRFMDRVSDTQDITPSDNIWWFYVNITRGAGKTTVITETLVMPVDTYNTTSELKIKTAGISGKCVSFSDVESGSWDEQLELQPENITSAFISPMPPHSITKEEDGTINMSGWGLQPRGAKGYSTFTSSTGFSYEDVGVTITPVKTDDVTKYYITGFDGEIIGELPWGVIVSTLACRTIMSSTSGYLQFRTSVNGHLTGTTWTIPMLAVDVSQNSWSSYVYSGSRQADIDQMRLGAESAKEQAMMGALMGSGSNMATGLMAGGMAGLGGPVGLGIGLATTAMSMVGAELNYRQQMDVNDRQQDINDYRAANQPNGLIMSGTGFDAIHNGNSGIQIRGVAIDEYSKGIRDRDINMFGVHVCEPTVDCTTLISEGGGLQISNLIVKGDIPVEAKRYIKSRLQGGVRLV